MSQLFHPTSHEEEIADLVERLPKYEAETFWREQLKGFTAAPLLATSARPEPSGERLGHEQVSISHAMKESLEVLARKHRLSRDTIYLAAWAYLLSRYSTEDRALFGVRFVSPQSNPERIWPLLVAINRAQSVPDWLNNIQKIRDDLKKREPVSERDLRLWCEVPAEQTLLQTVLDFTDTTAIANSSQRLDVRFSPDDTSIAFTFSKDCFCAESIRRLANQYVWLVQEIATNPTRTVGNLSILPPEQDQQIFREWNSNQRAYEHYDGLQQLFERKAAETPDAIAVEFPKPTAAILFERQLTYRELNFRANQLARHLQKLGVGPDVVVGISAERSIEMVIGVLAVIKAGGAYAPLDPTYPKERLAFMIEDTKAPVILTQQSFAQGFANSGSHVFCLDSGWSQVAGESGDNLLCCVKPDHLAYLIYTSGSTGKPKGVAMRHGPLINLLCWQMENWSGPATAKTLQFASLNFDVSFQEIFSTWCSGGTLVLITDEERRDAKALAHFLEANSIERLFLPFVALKHLAEACDHEDVYPPSLREVITAGEQLQVTPQILNFFSHLPMCTLENQYGPSETHVVTAHRLNQPTSQWPPLPSIGRPIANTRVYLLDDQKQPVPIGVPGELYLGGICLARGYLNRSELTAEKFLPDPFTQGRMYKTGDLGRWLPDGNIEYVGRIDHQVKIRGFRIELGEVETVLSKHPGVREAVVTARQTDRGDKQLIAYVVFKNGAVSSAELRSYLQQQIPPYCIPFAFVSLPNLPLTPNGKVDRRGLPEPTLIDESLTKVKMPRDPLEMQLKLVFEKFLQRRPISIDASFFELGGDSLQALRLIVDMERATGKKLELNILYQAPTIEALAASMRALPQGAVFSSLVPLQPHGTRTPLFLIHTTPGDVLGYGNLVYHLDAERPCYGLQSLGFNRPELSHASIEEMAAYYVRLIREKQPHGPYLLGGWCYGGIVSVEMAHQLRAAGEKVGPLLLIETPAAPPPLTNVHYYARRISCLLRMNLREWRTYFFAKHRYYSGRRQADEMRFRRVDNAQGAEVPAIEEQNQLLAKLERVYQTNLSAWQRYRARYYADKVVLFNAAEPDPAIIRDPKYGWPPLAKTVDTHIIPGNHDTILMEPHVRVLAEKINHCLLKAQFAD